MSTKDAPDKPAPMGDPDLVVTATAATYDATQSLASSTVTDGGAGRGELKNAASWDDFPNGRFGDFKSPAFGAEDLWGNSGLAVRLLLLAARFYTEWCVCLIRSMKCFDSGVTQKHFQSSPRFFWIIFTLKFLLHLSPRGLSRLNRW